MKMNNPPIRTEIVESSGDVYLRPGRQFKQSEDAEGPNICEILVSSDVMNRGSPVFKAMLKGCFRETQQVSRTHPGHIELPDDDAYAVLLMVKVLHQAPNIPERLSIWEFQDFAFICNKYHCVDKVRGWAKVWAVYHLRITELCDENQISNYFNLVHCTYALDLWEDFNSATAALARKFDEHDLYNHSSRWYPKPETYSKMDEEYTEAMETNGGDEKLQDEPESSETLSTYNSYSGLGDWSDHGSDDDADYEQMKLEYGLLPEKVLENIMDDQTERVKEIREAIYYTVGEMSHEKIRASSDQTKGLCVRQKKNVPQYMQFCVEEKIWGKTEKSLSHYESKIRLFGKLDWTPPKEEGPNGLQAHRCDKCRDHQYLIQALVRKVERLCRPLGQCLDCLKTGKVQDPYHERPGTFGYYFQLLVESNCRLAAKLKDERELGINSDSDGPGGRTIWSGGVSW